MISSISSFRVRPSRTLDSVLGEDNDEDLNEDLLRGRCRLVDDSLSVDRIRPAGDVVRTTRRSSTHSALRRTRTMSAAASGRFTLRPSEAWSADMSSSGCSSSSGDEDDDINTRVPLSWQEQDGRRRRSVKINFSNQSLDHHGLEQALRARAEDPPNKEVRGLFANNNAMVTIPRSVATLLNNLTVLDLSNNLISAVPEALSKFRCLANLSLRNNMLRDDSLPKSLGDNLALTLRELNLSGNMLTEFPRCVLGLRGLRNLLLGGNGLTSVPPEIRQLRKLKYLYMGGNRLAALPDEISHLKALRALILADNRLESLPASICRLTRLACLQLHLNQLTTLPHGLVYLRSLSELSLSDNPLVVRFVREMNFQPSSLLEMAAQTVKSYSIPYDCPGQVPRVLAQYLDGAVSCVNPRCRGVYFDSKVEHVKFVDFCGKYRVPLMQYLCSWRCSPDNPAFTESASASSREQAGPAGSRGEAASDEVNKLRRVLLG